MLTDKIIKAVHEDIPNINSQLEQIEQKKADKDYVDEFEIELDGKVNKNEFISGGDDTNGWRKTPDGWIEQWALVYYDVTTIDITGNVLLPRDFPNGQCVFSSANILQVSGTLSEMNSRFIVNNNFWSDGGIQKGRIYIKNVGDTYGVWGITLKLYWKGR